MARKDEKEDPDRYTRFHEFARRRPRSCPRFRSLAPCPYLFPILFYIIRREENNLWRRKHSYQTKVELMHTREVEERQHESLVRNRREKREISMPSQN